MTTENGKIVKATEIELFDIWLKRGADDIIPFPEFLRMMVRKGVVIDG